MRLHATIHSGLSGRFYLDSDASYSIHTQCLVAFLSAHQAVLLSSHGTKRCPQAREIYTPPPPSPRPTYAQGYGRVGTPIFPTATEYGPITRVAPRLAQKRTFNYLFPISKRIKHSRWRQCIRAWMQAEPNIMQAFKMGRKYGNHAREP